MGRLAHRGFRALLAGIDMGIAVLGTVPILLFLIAGTARSQDLFIWEFAGAPSNDQFGHSVARAGDVDADGTPDILVGAPLSAAGAGSARVYSGASGALLLNLAGTAAGDRFGWSVSSAGDVDGDGSDDVIVGAPRFWLTGPPGIPGYARVVSGATGATVLALVGSGSIEQFGFAVAGVGDLDGDATPDVAVGAPQFILGTGILGSGQVRVYSGAGGTLRYAWSVGGSVRFGHAIASAGDLDGDAVPDVIVGAPDTSAGPGGVYEGLATLFSGAGGAVLFFIPGPSLLNFLGGSVGPAGDVNGDAIPDVFVASSPGLGALGASPLVQVCSGIDGSTLLSFPVAAPPGWTSASATGASAAGLGDVDGDGVSDLAIAMPGGCDSACAPLPACCLYVVPSVDVRSGAGGSLIGRLEGSFSSNLAVAPAGDVDGDGKPDLLIGDPAGVLCVATSYAGRATVMSMLAPGASLFGTNCLSLGGAACRPLIGTTGGPPATGNSAFGIRASNVLGGTAAVLIAGASTLSPPLALPFGGCEVLVTPDVLVPATASGTGLGSGTATVGIPIPAAPSLVGQPAYFQWYVVDPGPALVPGALSQVLQVVAL